MKTWILTAYDNEAQHIIDMLWLQLIKKLQHISFYGNDSVFLAIAGIWKAQAAIWTTVLITEFLVEKIINVGIAGNLRWQEIKIWDVFLISSVFQHDVYLPFGWSHLDYIKKGINLPTRCDVNVWGLDFWYYENGICVTWDEFIDKKERCDDLQKRYWADVAEMEAFAVATVAREFWLLDNTFIIKAVSDWADSDASVAHEDNLDFAMKNSLHILKEVLK